LIFGLSSSSSLSDVNFLDFKDFFLLRISSFSDSEFNSGSDLIGLDFDDF